MNSELYNFHLCSLAAPSTQQLLLSSSSNCDSGVQTPYCISWNGGLLADAELITLAATARETIQRPPVPSPLWILLPLPLPCQQGGSVLTHWVLPMCLYQLQVELCNQLDGAAVKYVLTALQDEFHISFVASSVTLRSASSNMCSALDQPSVVNAYPQRELASSQIMGPFSTSPNPVLQVSWFGVIPKSNQPGKWLLILDFPSPSQRATVLMMGSRSPFFCTACNSGLLH